MPHKARVAGNSQIHSGSGSVTQPKKATGASPSGRATAPQRATPKAEKSPLGLSLVLCTTESPLSLPAQNVRAEIVVRADAEGNCNRLPTTTQHIDAVCTYSATARNFGALAPKGQAVAQGMPSVFCPRSICGQKTRPLLTRPLLAGEASDAWAR